MQESRGRAFDGWFGHFISALVAGIFTLIVAECNRYPKGQGNESVHTSPIDEIARIDPGQKEAAPPKSSNEPVPIPSFGKNSSPNEPILLQPELGEDDPRIVNATLTISGDGNFIMVRHMKYGELTSSFAGENLLMKESKRKYFLHMPPKGKLLIITTGKNNLIDSDRMHVKLQDNGHGNELRFNTDEVRFSLSWTIDPQTGASTLCPPDIPKGTADPWDWQKP